MVKKIYLALIIRIQIILNNNIINNEINSNEHNVKKNEFVVYETQDFLDIMDGKKKNNKFKDKNQNKKDSEK